ncbi:hypothetical protein BN1110_01349 [bacterium YEK0313]|nr:hypothetical protein BN1110_01349 [bacterium YEK0313]
MVKLDHDADGIVTLRLVQPYGAGDEAAYLSALETIGRLDRPFALIAVLGGGRALSLAGERAQALWYKATRDSMNRNCRGLAIVRPDATADTATTFQRLWSFPVSLAPDETAGRAALLRLIGAGA